MKHHSMKLSVRTARAALLAALLISLQGACAKNKLAFAYSGRMDVDAVTVSSQTSGVIDSLSIKEGDAVKKGEAIAVINTDRLNAQRRQQAAQLAEFDSRRGAAEAQVQQAEAQVRQATAQLDFSRDSLARTEKVLAQGGETRQGRDQLATQVTVNQAGTAAAESNLRALRANLKLLATQAEGARAGLDLTDVALREAQILSPLDGVVLNKFHYQGELAGVGTPLVELADLSALNVEVYVPLSKLGSVVIGQKASVTANGVSRPFTGTVYWIASESEFTPKTILTQETQTTLVYGVKIHVPNAEGILKVGEPVDVRF